ncbi:MAG: hypothetical protein PHN78_02030 [Dehalococcoidales bacterium]|nr:hypothetical protein [Dehalococcoidales bacterium]
MFPKKLLSGFLALILVLVMAAGCDSLESPSLKLIPQNANLIAQVQLSKILNDKDLIDAYDRANKTSEHSQTTEEMLNTLMDETGLDLRDFSQVTLFANVTNVEVIDYLGLIVEGTFDENQFIDNMESKTGRKFTNSDYKGSKLYTDEEEEFSIVFLSNRMFLIGSVKAIKDTIDVQKGDREQISGAILDAYNRLGNTLVRVAMKFPEDARKAITETPVPGGDLISRQVFTDLDILGFAFDKKTDNITIHIDSYFFSSDAAKDAREALSGAILLSKVMLITPEIKDLLGKIELDITESLVTIDLKTSLSKIEKLIEALSNEY